MHATWLGGWELSQHQQPVVHCGGDPGLPKCTVQQWVVVGKTNSRVSYYQSDCSGGLQATSDASCKMVAGDLSLKRKDI